MNRVSFTFTCITFMCYKLRFMVTYVLISFDVIVSQRFDSTLCQS